MSAAALIRQLSNTGIRLTAEGDKLHVEANPGSLTPDLRALLVNRKADLIIALRGRAGSGRADPHGASPDYGKAAPLSRGVICTQTQGTAASGWNSPSECLVALADDVERKAGRVPAGDTAAILCRSCGLVWVHPSIAAVLPVVNGWPRALGCPWCLIPKNGRMAIPRPSVTCGSCAHFTADATNPQGGAGRCKLGIQPRRTSHPFTPQYCGSWRP